MPANALSSATWAAMLAHRRLDRRPGDRARRPRDRVRHQRRVVFRRRPGSSAAPATTRRPRRSRRCAAGSRSPAFPTCSKASRTCGGARTSSALMFVKAGWGLAGGVLLLLTIFGQRIFPVGGSTAAGIGVLYGARGIGAGLGPMALRWMLGQTPTTLRRTIGPAYFMVGGFYVALAAAGTLPLAALVRAAARISADRFSGCSARCCCRWKCRTVSRPRVRRGARAGDVDVVDLELLDRLRARRARLVAALAGVRAGRDVLRARRRCG